MIKPSVASATIRTASESAFADEFFDVFSGPIRIAFISVGVSTNFLILFIGKLGIFKLGFVFKIEREIRVRADVNIESDVV